MSCLLAVRVLGPVLGRLWSILKTQPNKGRVPMEGATAPEDSLSPLYVLAGMAFMVLFVHSPEPKARSKKKVSLQV